MFFGTLVEEWTLDTGYTDEVGFFTQMGVDYTYTVTAVNSYGQGAEGSALVNIGGTGDTPSAPTNLTAFGMNQSALLAWDEPVNPSASGFDKYELFRAPAQGGPWVSIQNITYGFFHRIFWINSRLRSDQWRYLLLSGPSGQDRRARQRIIEHC